MRKTKLRDPYDSRDEYHRRTLVEAHHHQQEIENAPLSDRQEARAEFGTALKDPLLIAERVGWLIDGNYGHGEMLQAKRIIASPRVNRRAALTHLIGMYEWQCPVEFGVQTWKKLSSSEKKALDDALDVVIAAAEEEMRGEQ